ncbi:alanine racemase [Lewinella sp. JB7]|uniref:alanine racemase n=1 Tax=Lewinella sp. JB7 TaxID=2962887 RepID=UPI0020C9995B|nr:alanine racemase [Lewinella sp. JB7]MCP9235580.1 alanine racemase [Lewinella sp. JB7]
MRELHIPDIPTQLPELYGMYRDYDLVVDSRLISKPGDALFLALPGERRDGHAFIAPLVRAGVTQFAVARDRIDDYRQEIEVAAALQHDADGSDRLTLLIVDSPLRLLQELARFHRQQFRIPVVGITGSNGKTIVKDWLSEVLSTEYRVCASPRSYNSAIGVPLSVWRMNSTHEVAIFEAGISRPGQMQLLRDIMQPTGGILTSLGTAHLANFDSADELRAEKLSLFQHTDWVVLPAELCATDQAVAALFGVKVHRWVGEGRTGLDLNGQVLDITFPDWPAPYLANGRSVVTCALQLGMELPALQTAIEKLVPLSNRLERREGRDGGPVINDSYSNDLTALAAAIQFSATHDPFNHLTLILGTVQAVENREARLTALLHGRARRLILVGSDHESLRDAFPDCEYYASVDLLLRNLHRLSFREQTVLVKGASYEHFERIADLLTGQVHRTILEVDLPALRHNFRTYRSRIPPGCGMIVMAKASAYGSGALPVAQAVEDAGAEYLAVAYPEEGRELRRGGITLPIMVLNAEVFSFPLLAEYQLEPVVHDLTQLRLAASLDLPVHVELDTGMGRLGFRPDEFRKHFSAPSPETQAAIRSLFTHLAAAEDARHDDFTHHQLDLFDELYAVFRAGGGARVRRHALNSNGITRFVRGTYEMVRLGIGLFGVGDRELRAQLQPALSLTTTVTSLTDRRAGESIGYGRRGVLDRDRRIAVLSVGYADGLPRLAGGGNFAVRIHGRPAPTIGTICMDMCTVDVSVIPEVRVGDRVTIFGPEHPIELLADAARTIPYEILTGIGPRVHRIYVGE